MRQWQTRLRLRGTIQDITERKRAEEALRESEARYRRLFENAQFGIYRSTPGGRVVLVNPSLLAMLGYTSIEELAQRNLESEGFEPGYDRRWFREVIERDGIIRNHEATWTRRDGKTLYVLESAVAVRDSEGAVLYYDGTVVDITGRKAAEDALQKAEQKIPRDLRGRAGRHFSNNQGGQIAGHESGGGEDARLRIPRGCSCVHFGLGT